MFDAQSNTKIMNSAIKEIERICPNKAVMVISSDLISKKLTVLCQVPKVSDILNLKAWTYALIRVRLEKFIMFWVIQFRLSLFLYAYPSTYVSEVTDNWLENLSQWTE